MGGRSRNGVGDGGGFSIILSIGTSTSGVGPRALRDACALSQCPTWLIFDNSPDENMGNVCLVPPNDFPTLIYSSTQLCYHQWKFFPFPPQLIQVSCWSTYFILTGGGAEVFPGLGNICSLIEGRISFWCQMGLLRPAPVDFPGTSPSKTDKTD